MRTQAIALSPNASLAHRLALQTYEMFSDLPSALRHGMHLLRTGPVPPRAVEVDQVASLLVKGSLCDLVLEMLVQCFKSCTYVKDHGETRTTQVSMLKASHNGILSLSLSRIF
jgi:hypothetical protein